MTITQLEQYCTNHGIITVTYQEAADLISKASFDKIAIKKSGFALRNSEYDAIFYDDDMPYEEKYLTFAHEVGHHVMQHLTSRSYKCAAEAEADVFASVLMALSVFTEVNKAVSATK